MQHLFKKHFIESLTIYINLCAEVNGVVCFVSKTLWAREGEANVWSGWGREFLTIATGLTKRRITGTDKAFCVYRKPEWGGGVSVFFFILK